MANVEEERYSRVEKWNAPLQWHQQVFYSTFDHRSSIHKKSLEFHDQLSDSSVPRLVKCHKSMQQPITIKWHHRAKNSQIVAAVKWQLDTRWRNRRNVLTRVSHSFEKIKVEWKGNERIFAEDVKDFLMTTKSPPDSHAAHPLSTYFTKRTFHEWNAMLSVKLLE